MGRNGPDGGFGAEKGSTVFLFFLVWSSTVRCRKYFQRNVVVHGAEGKGFEPT